MSAKILFFVQPYTLKRTKLVAQGALTFLSRAEALQTGAALARWREGIVVLSQTYDAVRQQLNPPSILTVHGRVPDEWSGGHRVAA